jgi:hypothetical protein
VSHIHTEYPNKEQPIGSSPNPDTVLLCCSVPRTGAGGQAVGVLAKWICTFIWALIQEVFENFVLTTVLLKTVQDLQET